ncbi:MAG: hypothetical protein Q4C87_00670 [Actinomycetaceae bacterium]|nr:hypothetical protein [Actinomycetaceae bacterium]
MTLWQPYLRKLGALSAIAVFALSMSACSFRVWHTHESTGTPKSSTTTQDNENSEAPAADETQSDTGGGQSGAQGDVLASREGVQGAPYRIDVLAIEGSSSKTTVRFRMTNLSDSEKVEMTALLFGEDKNPDSLDLRLLVGPDLIYNGLKTPDGQCSCSTDIGDIEPGQSVELYSDFPALPDNYEQISVAFPHDGAFHGLPVTRS